MAPPCCGMKSLETIDNKIIQMTLHSQSTRPEAGWLPNQQAPVLFLIVPGCFFVSGVAGLIYEVLWLRIIDKVTGSAPFAVATVLSVFMGGLALGSYVAGRTVDRISSRKRLLSLYAIFELCIAGYALLLPFLVGAMRPVYRLFYDSLLHHFWCYQALAFLGCAGILIVPASLMGATLPLLCRFYVRHLSHLGARTGWLYGLNTVGGAVGAVLCGFLLVKSLGVWSTLGIAALLNLLVGVSCLLLLKYIIPPTLPSDLIPSKNAPSLENTKSMGRLQSEGDRRLQAKWVLTLFALSGFCALAYEVLWTRLLGLIVGPTTYSFTLVISTFIIGLALGSILFGRLADRVRNAFLLLIITQLCASFLALLVSHILGNSQFFFAKLIHVFHNSFPLLILVQSLVLWILLMGPTLFLGAAFPLVNKIYVQSMADLGASLGKAYALNTLGAILGSFTAGFFLIPLLGKENGLRLILLVQFAAAGLALLHTETGFRKRTLGKLCGTCVILLYFALLWSFPSWQHDLLSRGWYRDFKPIESALHRAGWLDALWNGPEWLAKQRKGLEVVFHGEGIGGFTTVEKEITSLGTEEYAMFNSGKADASSHGDRSTQTLSAHIPLLFHPGARNVMVLGLASGMTAGEVLLYPIEKLDVVEINEEVVKACKSFFKPWNYACLNDPRSRLIVQDGRNHLAMTHEKYDVIISEPSNPWMSGLAKLFSREFFQLAKERLKENGIFAQWIQSYEMDWETFSLLGRTFAEVFPNGALFKVGPVDYLLLGLTDPRGLDWQHAQNHLRFARKSINVTFPGVDFLVHLILTEDLVHLFGSGPVHTDHRPYLEFAAPLKLYSGRCDMDRAIEERRRLSADTLQRLKTHRDPDTLLDLIEFSASANVPVFNLLKLCHLSDEQQARYKTVVTGYCSRVLVPSYGVFIDPKLKACCAETQIKTMRKHISLDDPLPSDHYNLALALAAADRRAEAMEELRKTISMDPMHEPGYLALGLLMAEIGEFKDAAMYLENAVSLAPQKTELYKYLGMIEMQRGAYQKAISYLSRAQEHNPDDPEILGELGIAHRKLGQNEEAIALLKAALTRNPRDAETSYQLGMAFLQSGEKAKAAEQFSAAVQSDPRDKEVSP